jgi:5-methylcytosine-specific restriction endonuclease McrA
LGTVRLCFAPTFTKEGIVMKQIEKYRRSTMKRRANESMKGLSDNEIAEQIKKATTDFLKTEEWFLLKAQTIAKYGCTCMRCKKKISCWMDINVDHIKPRKLFPTLANDPNNLQILCGACNKAKGNKHDTDYRP